MTEQKKQYKIAKEYRVCGLIVWIFAAIICIAGLVALISMAVSGSMTGKWIGLGIVLLLVVIAMRVFTGLLMAKDVIHQKGVYILFSLLTFLFALTWTVGLLVLAMVGIIMSTYLISALVLTILGIVAFLAVILWNGSLGILLAIKNSEAKISEDSEEEIPFDNTYEVTGEIEGVYGGYKGRRTKLYAHEICQVGRGESSTVMIMHPKVSREHCTIRRPSLSRGYLVTDSSTNGTFYQEERLPRGEECEIPAGALLLIGNEENVLRLN